MKLNKKLMLYDIKINLINCNEREAQEISWIFLIKLIICFWYQAHVDKILFKIFYAKGQVDTLSWDGL
jgi:hypothetical protein